MSIPGIKAKGAWSGKNFPVSMRLGDTPVPISNTTVKTQSADGTIPETVWESRWMPDYFFKINIVSKKAY